MLAGDLVYMDAGCVVDGYASDISRAWPVNGRYDGTLRHQLDLMK